MHFAAQMLGVVAERGGIKRHRRGEQRFVLGIDPVPDAAQEAERAFGTELDQAAD